MHVVCFFHRVEMEMVKIVKQSIETKHFRFFNNLGGSFASPAGRTHFQKVHPTAKVNANIIISWNFSE